LTNQCTDIDEQVEVHVNFCCGQCGIDNNSFAALGGCDEELEALVLFCDQRRNVGFETTSADTCATKRTLYELPSQSSETRLDRRTHNN
jgi:hypothetical protein